MKLELFYPIKPYKLSQSFGENRNTLYKELGMFGHNGHDIPCPTGTPIYAAHEGEITYAGVDSSGGYGVVIRTLEQFNDIKGTPSYWKTIYWHLIKTIPVKVGQKVKPGDIIGYGDTTGRATGSHLHFGLKPIAQGENEWTWMNIQQNNGYFGAVDPNPYFVGYYSVDAQKIYNILRSIIMILSDFLKGRNK